MNNPSRQMLRALRRTNLVYPLHCVQLAPELWPAPDPRGPRPYQMWRSRSFLVQVFDQNPNRPQPEETPTIIRLSINRTQWDERQNTWSANISWEELQRVKREVGFGSCDAVEIFPDDKDVVNVANMRHLWILPDRIPFAWRLNPGVDE